MPTIKVNGIDFYYEESGNGEPLLIISGLAADLRSLAAVVPSLAKRYRVIIFDNRGAGQTETPAGPYTTPLLADDVVKLMDALAIPQAHIIGHSMGGAIAQQMALKNPQRINRLILMSTFIKSPVRTQLVINSTLGMLRHGSAISLIAAANLPWLYSSAFLQDEEKMVAALDQMIYNPTTITVQGYENQAYACNTHDTSQQLHHIKIKTLVVCGDDDLMAPAEQAEKIAAMIPKAQLTIMPTVGHIPHIENPTAYVSIVTDFFG